MEPSPQYYTCCIQRPTGISAPSFLIYNNDVTCIMSSGKIESRYHSPMDHIATHAAVDNNTLHRSRRAVFCRSSVGPGILCLKLNLLFYPYSLTTVPIILFKLPIIPVLQCTCTKAYSANYPVKSEKMCLLFQHNSDHVNQRAYFASNYVGIIYQGLLFCLSLSCIIVNAS